MKKKPGELSISDVAAMNAMRMRVFFQVWEAMEHSAHPVIKKINELNIVSREELEIEAKKLLPESESQTPVEFSAEERFFYYTIMYFEIEINKTDIAEEQFREIKANVPATKVSFEFFRKNVERLYTRLLEHLADSLKDYPQFTARKKLLDNHFAVN